MTLRVIPDRHGPAPWARRGKVMEVRVQNATDDELARNARLGCVASFEELARRLQAPLVRFISRRFPSRRDAEDLTQETLLRAYQSLGSYRAGRSFRTWIFTIAYRLTISRGRAESSTSSLGEEIDDVRCDPSDILERDEQRDRIWSIARTVSDERAGGCALALLRRRAPRRRCRPRARALVGIGQDHAPPRPKETRAASGGGMG